MAIQCLCLAASKQETVLDCFVATLLSMNLYRKSLNIIDTVRPEQSVPKLHRDAASKGERCPSTPRPDKASDALLRMNGFMVTAQFWVKLKALHEPISQVVDSSLRAQRSNPVTLLGFPTAKSEQRRVTGLFRRYAPRNDEVHGLRAASKRSRSLAMTIRKHAAIACGREPKQSPPRRLAHIQSVIFASLGALDLGAAAPTHTGLGPY